MSEFHPAVVKLGKVGKNPNADTLSITTINGYPVQFKAGNHQEGDLVVHIPVDAVVDVSLPAFSWLADKAHNGKYRVKAAKLRGIPSYGFLVPLTDLPPGEYTEGQDIRTFLNVEKYDPGPAYQLSGETTGEGFSSHLDNMVPHYDIEGLRKYTKVFQPGEWVSVTEKIHGSNGRWLHLNGDTYSGSRTKWRRHSVWNLMAEEYGLHNILQQHEGVVLFGEVYGPGIQDLTYGVDKPKAMFFDCYDTKKGLWWSVEEFRRFCIFNNLPMVPELFRGPYDAEAIAAMAEGTSTLPGATSQVREGIVVKPLVERWDQEIGRVFLKLPGEGYLLRKQ